MRDEKRKKLEASGWRVGTARDFLELSEQDAAYVEIRLRLVDALRRERSRQRVSQEAVAKRARSSQSRVAKMESGDESVSIDLLVRTLLSLGMSARRMGRVIGGTASAK